jgi:hypothetical protein
VKHHSPEAPQAIRTQNQNHDKLRTFLHNSERFHFLEAKPINTHLNSENKKTKYMILDAKQTKL